MQLSRLYSNLPSVFEPIDFNSGEQAAILNVVFARVERPKDREKDSHNLGKTTLIHLLDFCLLKQVPDTSSHFLAVHRERFSQFTFFLEIALNTGGFVTVRRSVESHNEIAFKKHDVEKLDLTDLPDDKWDHVEVALNAAVDLLDSYLDLKMVAPWNYRKGFSYFLRSQDDYRDVFQIQKFVQGKDREWKPYLAKIFGLDYESAHKKYVIDQRIEEKAKLLNQKKNKISPDHQERNSLATEIEIKRDELAEVEFRLDGFDFTHEEQRISRRLVSDVEHKIAEAVNDIYNLDADIAQIDGAISTGFSFDLDRITQIFEEAKVILPDGLKRDYEELLGFNKKLTRDRNAALKKRKKELEAERDGLRELHEELNEERKGYLAVLREVDTFKKYKALQKQFSDQRSQLTFLEIQLERLDELAEIEEEIRLLNQERDQCIASISASLRREIPVRNNVVRLFNRYVKRVLNINGEFVILQNKEGNLDFKIRTKDVTGKDTSQADGKSYGHLICALFDLAVLKALEDTPFFHFVYHDGLLEGLDNRKKILVLDLIRKVIDGRKIQYMLSAIDSDLPRDDDEQKITFSDDEIVLSLHDDGDQGRLFKMPGF